MRAGVAESHGAQGSAAKWAHAAMALAIRSLGSGDAQPASPAAVLTIVERVMREGDARSGQSGPDLCDADALALLRSWLDAMALGIDEATLLRMLQDGALSHADLQRRARRIHERRLGKAVGDLVSSVNDGRLDVARHGRGCSTPACRRSRTRPRPRSSGVRSSS